MKASLLIFIGGGIGSVLRNWVSILLKNTFTTSAYPWGTFTVNILGSLLIGFLTTLFLKDFLNADLRLLLIVGLCGGFTTFSTFTNDSLGLLRDGYYIHFFVYVFGSLALGILAVLVGHLLANTCIR